jgi:hypothetical protein
MEAVALKPSGWNSMPPGDKQAWLLDQALDRKREILTMPLPDDGDDSLEATRLRALILAAADSTISQTIALRSNMLATAQDTHDQELAQLIEERRQAALLEIAKLREEPRPAWPNGRTTGLLGGDGTMPAEGKALLSRASAASPWPVFQNVGLHAARHDAEPEAFHFAVINDAWLASRLKRINRPFRDSRHVAFSWSNPKFWVRAC